VARLSSRGKATGGKSRKRRGTRATGRGSGNRGANPYQGMAITELEGRSRAQRTLIGHYRKQGKPTFKLEQELNQMNSALAKARAARRAGAK